MRYGKRYWERHGCWFARDLPIVERYVDDESRVLLTFPALLPDHRHFVSWTVPQRHCQRCVDICDHPTRTTLAERWPRTPRWLLVDGLQRVFLAAEADRGGGLLTLASGGGDHTCDECRARRVL